MEVDSKTRAGKVVTFFLALFLLFNEATAQEKGNSYEVTDTFQAYCIFDSAERYFIQLINSRNDRPVGFVIDSRCLDCCTTMTLECHYHLWRVGIVYADEWQNCPDIFDILSVSQRMIKIGGVNYPVAQMWYDNVFTKTKKRKRNQSGENWVDCIKNSLSVIVNMSLHEYYLK